MFRRERRPRRWPIPLALLVLAWLGGLVWFAATVPDRVDDADTPTDAIAVLTGGSGRIDVGLDLLHRGLAKKLFVSGVYRGVDVAELLKLARQSPADVECCVVLGHAADNTAGNAEETAAWMRAEGFHSLRLVTANYHMRRALLEFRAAMPGATIVPHPVFPDAVHQGRWWMWPGTTRLILGEYVKYLVALAATALGADEAPPGAG